MYNVRLIYHWYPSLRHNGTHFCNIGRCSLCLFKWSFTRMANSAKIFSANNDWTRVISCFAAIFLEHLLNFTVKLISYSFWIKCNIVVNIQRCWYYWHQGAFAMNVNIEDGKFSSIRLWWFKILPMQIKWFWIYLLWILFCSFIVKLFSICRMRPKHNKLKNFCLKVVIVLSVT